MPYTTEPLIRSWLVSAGWSDKCNERMGPKRFGGAWLASYATAGTLVAEHTVIGPCLVVQGS
jgi:hypothetical protein